MKIKLWKETQVDDSAATREDEGRVSIAAGGTPQALHHLPERWLRSGILHRARDFSPQRIFRVHPQVRSPTFKDRLSDGRNTSVLGRCTDRSEIHIDIHQLYRGSNCVFGMISRQVYTNFADFSLISASLQRFIILR